jgi:hypothetical protein
MQLNSHNSLVGTVSQIPQLSQQQQLQQQHQSQHQSQQLSLTNQPLPRTLQANPTMILTPQQPLDNQNNHRLSADKKTNSGKGTPLDDPTTRDRDRNYNQIEPLYPVLQQQQLQQQGYQQQLHQQQQQQQQQQQIPQSPQSPQSLQAQQPGQFAPYYPPPPHHSYGYYPYQYVPPGYQLYPPHGATMLSPNGQTILVPVQTFQIQNNDDEQIVQVFPPNSNIIDDSQVQNNARGNGKNKVLRNKSAEEKVNLSGDKKGDKKNEKEKIIKTKNSSNNNNSDGTDTNNIINNEHCITPHNNNNCSPISLTPIHTTTPTPDQTQSTLPPSIRSQPAQAQNNYHNGSSDDEKNDDKNEKKNSRKLGKRKKVRKTIFTRLLDENGDPIDKRYKYSDESDESYYFCMKGTVLPQTTRASRRTRTSRSEQNTVNTAASPQITTYSAQSQTHHSLSIPQQQSPASFPVSSQHVNGGSIGADGNNARGAGRNGAIGGPEQILTTNGKND